MQNEMLTRQGRHLSASLNPQLIKYYLFFYFTIFSSSASGGGGRTLEPLTLG